MTLRTGLLNRRLITPVLMTLWSAETCFGETSRLGVQIPPTPDIKRFNTFLRSGYIKSLSVSGATSVSEISLSTRTTRTAPSYSSTPSAYSVLRLTHAAATVRTARTAVTTLNPGSPSPPLSEPLLTAAFSTSSLLSLPIVFAPPLPPVCHASTGWSSDTVSHVLVKSKPSMLLVAAEPVISEVASPVPPPEVGCPVDSVF